MVTRESITPPRPPQESVVVLYVTNSASIGGGNRCLMDLITGLDSSRFQPVLVSPADGQLVEWASRQGVPHVIIGAGDWDGRVGLIRRSIRLVATIMRYRVKIVHAAAPTCYRAAGLAARLTGASRVCHLGYPPEEGELTWSFQVAPDVVIACNHGQARDVAPTVLSIAPVARLVTVPYGIDEDRFSPPVTGDTPAAWHPRKPVVLIVGHLSEVKGYPTFFRAAAQVIAGGEDCTFVALGGETASPGYRASLEQLVGDLGLAGRVLFLGWRSDVEAVLRSADMVVMPSLAEGLPLAVLEAMMCARPIIATPVGGIPEAITHEVTGLLVPPLNAGALAQSIVRLLRDPAFARTLGEQARMSAVNYFSLTREVSEIQAIYDDLLRPPHIGQRVAVSRPETT